MQPRVILLAACARSAQRRRRGRAAGGGSLGRRCSGDLGHQLALAGPADGAYVVRPDRRPGAVLRARRRTPRPPASVEKLYTTTTALDALRPHRAPHHDRARRRHARPRRRLGRHALPARRRRPDVRLAPASSAATTAASGASVSHARRAAGPRGRHPRAITGSIDRRRVLLRLAARRALERLRARPVPRRHAQRARLQPRRTRPRARRRTRPAAYAAHAAAGSALQADGVRDPRRTRRRQPRPPGAMQLAQVHSPHDRPAARADAAAVGQLLRRDAREGPRRAVRRRRHDGGGRGGGPRRRSPRCSASTRSVVDGSGLSRRRPHLALRRSPTCSWSCWRRRSARCCANTLAVAGRDRHARQRHARHRRRRAAARARPARSPASPTSSATAPPRDGHTLAFAIFTDGIADPTTRTRSSRTDIGRSRSRARR